MQKLMIMFSLLVLCGCAGMPPKYSYFYHMEKPVTQPELSYSDDNVALQFKITPYDVEFDLTNKTDGTVKIVWDESAIVKHGKALRIVHDGVRIMERDQPQAPTIVPARAKVEEAMTPTENYDFSFFYGSWQKKPLFVGDDAGNPKVTKEIMSNKGQHLQVLLTLEIMGKKQEYSFDFVVADIQKRK